MRSFSFWQKWLSGIAILIVVFGLGMALLSATPLFEWIHLQVNPVFWGTAAVPSSFTNYAQWMYGVLGATMAGWGIFLLFLVQHPFKNRQRWAWNCIGLGLLTWYLIDTSISILSRVYFNAWFNTVLLVAVFVPLAFTRKAFEA